MTFIDKVKQGAINGWHSHQILPSISIGQAILESASGTSSLASTYKNLFGIKASADWSGKTINLPTTEWGSGGAYATRADFRWYDSWEQSMIDHAAFFTSTPWRTENYKNVVGETDYKKASWALQNAPAPYATDPMYATKLIARIEQNNLTQYDTEALNGKPSNVTRIKKTVGGTLEEIAKTTGKTYNVTLIGDSLGVGTYPHLTNMFKSFNQDTLGSRQITHATGSLNGTQVLQTMVNNGTLKDIVIVILGTNRGVTDTEVDNFVSIAGSNRKIIFVDTNSSVNHRQSVSDAYRRASEKHNNAYFANWKDYSYSMRSRYYGGDDIHMTNEGYVAHADFIRQAVYESGVGIKSTLGVLGSDTEYVGIEDIEYNKDGLISPLGESVLYNPSANEIWGNKVKDKGIWIENVLEIDSNDPYFILNEGIRYMKENEEPASQYTVDLARLPNDVSIGDWGLVLDHHFNPPLYINARVLEIRTSETDPSSNQAVIGNVTEVHPADRSDIFNIQSELKDIRENLVREYRKEQPPVVTIESTNGQLLGDEHTETQLEVRVMQGDEDITDTFKKFTWERTSNTPVPDDEYNEIISSQNTKFLKVSSDDIINNVSVFTARVFIGKELVNQSDITIRHNDTALWIDIDAPPETAKDGAKWVDSEGNQKVKVDGVWEDQVDQAQLFSVRGEVEGAMAEAEQAKQDAVDKANQALADAKAHADAEVQASKEHFDSLIEDVESDVADAQATADSAVEQIDTAVANAGFTSLDDTIQNMNYITMNADQSAHQAITDASNAYGLAQTSISEAQTAQTNSLTALGKADNALDGVSSLNVRVDDVEAELELKADNTFMNEDGTLTTLSNAITFNAHRFSSDMSRIESRVESLAGEINLVILRNAFENTWILAGEVYPNTTANIGTDTMSEVIEVLEGEQLALSKITIDDHINNNTWRIGFYDSSHNYITRITTSANQYILTVPAGATKMWVSYPTDSQPQIVRGTSFVPYRPNLADQMTTDEVTIFRNEYDEFADRTERRLTAVDSSGGRLDVAENLITQTANGLTLKADQSTVDTLAGTVSSLGTEFDVVAGEVSSKVWMSDIDDLEIGGRNLIVQSTITSGYLTMTGAHINDPVFFYTDFIPVSEYSQLIASGFTDLGGLPSTVYYDANKAFVKGINNAGQSRSRNIVIDSGISYIRFSGRKIDLPTIKLEKGNKATDWTPAPEDTDTKIDYIETEWTQTFDTFSQTVSGIDGRVSTQKQTIDEISSTVSGHGGRLTTVEQTANGLKSEVYNADGSSKITQLATGISSVVTDLDNLEVGGRNLLRNSEERVLKPQNTGNASDNYHFETLSYPTVDGQTYTISSDVEITDGALSHITVLVNYGNTGSSTLHVPIENGKITRTYVAHDTMDSNRVILYAGRGGETRGNGVIFRNIKIEKGNKATDWTPAPEDMATMDYTTSQISQLADNINLRVTKGDVINQINVSTEGILIDGKKTHITGTTTIDDGVIKNAHIANLNASKINAGTIDSERIKATEIVTKGLTTDVVTATHIKADTTLIDNIFATTALIERLTSKTAFINNIKAISIDVDKITGDLGEFINLSLKAQNSQASLSGSSFKIESIANIQSYIEMSNVPEIRARSANSSMVVMGQGLTNYSVDNIERFFMGTKINGTQHGIMIRKNQGWAIMRESDSFGGTPAKYYTVKSGQQRVAVVEALMADSTVTEVPTGNATQFIINSNYLARLNGFSTSTSSTIAAPWPNLTTGYLIKYSEGTPGNESGSQSIFKIWTDNNTSVSAFDAHVTFNTGYSGASDRRIKHNIQGTSVEALSHINSLKFKEFKYNSDNRYEPLGIIAQDSGILRVKGEKMESIDIQRAIMLGLKGVQELQKIVDAQAEEIRQLKEIINQ